MCSCSSRLTTLLSSKQKTSNVKYSLYSCVMCTVLVKLGDVLIVCWVFLKIHTILQQKIFIYSTCWFNFHSFLFALCILFLRDLLYSLFSQTRRRSTIRGIGEKFFLSSKCMLPGRVSELHLRWCHPFQICPEVKTFWPKEHLNTVCVQFVVTVTNEFNICFQWAVVPTIFL